MKNFIAFLICISFAHLTYSQIKLDKVLERQQKKTEKKIENRVEKKIDKGVDKALDKTEEGIEESVKSDTQNKAKEPKKSTPTDERATASSNSSEGTPNTQPILTWSKFDFMPGAEIIFEDNFENEQNGEFPSRWDLSKGGVIENALVNNEKVVYFRKGNSNVPDGIVPYLKNRAEDYLPDEFTVEFDCYFSSKNQENGTYYLFLYDSKNQAKIASPSRPIRTSWNKIEYNQIGDEYPGIKTNKPIEGWRHISISFNKRSLKCYFDDTRLVNIPNCEFNPTGITLSFHNTSGNLKGFVKNIRIAKGAVPLYDKFLTDGKFVTTGIKFDVNKATIKPESMGTINYVAKMLTDHPELKFSVEGHTDTDGDDAANQKLSEARAKSVADKLIELGIAPNRLTSKGWGETKPFGGNDAPEGKANNRRVEFVKI